MATVSKLQIVLEATTTAFDRGLRSATHTLQGFARQVGQMHDRMDGFARRHREALQGLQSAGKMAGVGLGAMAWGIKGAVDEAIEFESAMARVNKVMDFDTPEALQNMRKELEKLAVSGTTTFVELAQIAEAGGQFGVLEKDLIGFVSMVSDMATAFDMSSDVAGEAMAKLANVWNKPMQEMGEFGDMINLISNNIPAKASQIVEALGRIGGTAKAFGLSEQGAVSLTSAMIGLGKAPEIASRAINHMLSELAMLDLKDKSVSASIKQLGFDVNDFGKLLKTNAEEALFVFLEAMNKLPKDEQIGFSVDMFGKNFGDDILALATAPELLEKIRTLLSDNANYAGSMTKEAQVLSDTTEGQIKKFQNNISVLKANIGDVFLPTLNEIMEKLTPILQAVSEWTTQNAELVKTITVITAGVLGVIATLGSLALAFTAVTSGIGSMIAIGKMIAVIVAPIINAIKFMQMFGLVLAGLGFPVTAVVAGITALVAGGVLLWQNWDTVKVKAQEVWFAIGEIVAIAVENTKAHFVNMGAWLGGAWESVKTTVITKIDEIKQAFFKWLAGMPAPVQEMIANIVSIFKGMAMAWDTLKTSAQSAWQWVKDTANSTAQEIATAWRDFVSDLSATWGDIKARAKSAWDSVVDVTEPMMDTLTNIVKAGLTVIVGVWQAQFIAIKLAVGVVFEGIKAVVNGGINAVKVIFTAGLTVFASVFNAGFGLIKNAFTTTFNVIKALVRGDMQGVANAIRTGLNNAWNIAKKGANDILSAFTGLGVKLKQAGIDAIQGLIDGISSRFNAVRSKVSEIAELIPDGVKRLLDIHSPSRVMRELGAWAGEGFVLGVGDKVKDAKQVAQNLANALTSTVKDLHRQHFMLMNEGNPLADLEHKLQFGELAELTDKQKERLRELAKINLDIQKANEATAKALQEQEQSAQNILNANDRSKSNYENLQKQIALFGNQSKLAEFDHDWANGKYADVDNMLVLRERSAIAQLESKTAFEQVKKDLADELPPLAKLQKELDDRLTIIQDFENAHTGVTLEAQKARQQAEANYLSAKNNLMLTTYEQGLGAVNGIIKSAFGEQSGIYRAMFAMEKGMALARVLLNNKVALSQAWADPTATTLFQKMANVATVAIQTGVLQSAIGAIRPVIGQAHDGIMSVPKSGTWNLEKGERVLPKHTAQNLDRTLAELQGKGRGETKIIINNYSGEKTDVQKMPNGDMMVTIGKMIDAKVDAKINQRFIQARRQGGELYGR